MESLYFVFCKDDLVLERQADGTYTLPYGDKPPTEVKPWTTVMAVTPMDDGTEVRTYNIDTPSEQATTSCHSISI